MKKHFEKIKSEGTCIHRLDEELIRRRRDELRCAPRENRKGWVKVKSKQHLQTLPGVQKILTFPAFLHFSCLYRHALDIREHYERKLERANNLYMELSAIMLQLEVREKELMKYVKKLCFIVDMGRLPCYHIFHYQASLVVSQATV